jgi:integrase
MKGKDLPSYIHRRKRDGVLLFRRRYGGKIVEVRLETQFPEGDPIPFALHQERERILNDPAPVAPGKDLAAVIRHYFASPRYTDLAQRTQKDYDKHIAYFQKKMAHLLPRNVERHHVISWHSAWGKNETPHAANYRLTVMKILMEHAKDMGLLTKEMENPAKGIKAIKYDKQDRKPWPQDKIEAYRRVATGRSLLVFEMCIGTGQRIADVLKMKWGDIQDGGIVLRQNKTQKDLWVPLTSPLSAALSITEKRSDIILTTHRATGT